MGINLDKINFKKQDPGNMIAHLEDFSASCENAHNQMKDFVLPSYYIKAKKFVIVGMGGSGIAGDIIADVLYDKNIVVKSVHDYKLPGWVDENTIVIANSYSGDTEETLSAFISAQNLGAKLIANTTGGRLKVLAQKFKAPSFIFDYKSVPRASFPYFFISLIKIFNKLGFLDLEDNDIIKSFEYLDVFSEKIKVSVATDSNRAKLLAQKLAGNNIIIYSSGQLKSVGRRYKSQINENSKNFAFVEYFPELNHNALEGIIHPKKNNFVIILESNYDLKEVVTRQRVTAEILKNNNISCEQIKFVPCDSWFSEILSTTLFGDYLSYYLGILNSADISKTDQVDYLKSRL